MRTLFRVLRQSPERGLYPFSSLLEDRFPRTHRREEGVVKQYKLIKVSDLVPTEVSQAVLISADVHALVTAYEHIMGNRIQPCFASH